MAKHKHDDERDARDGGSSLSGVREAVTIAERRGLEHPLTKYRAKQSPPMSLASLARLLGVSRSYIHRVELGTRQIGPELLPLVCRRTGLTPEIIRPDLAWAMRRAQAAE